MTAPSFIDRTITTIIAAVKSTYEQAIGKTLFPAQPEQLLINGAAYRELLVRNQIQIAAQRNLVNYSDGEYLNELGALVGVERLQPAKARTTIRFSRTDSVGLLIPAGFLVAADGGDQLWYETLENLEIPNGVAFGEIGAQAIATGIQFNNLSLGSINTSVDTVAGRTFTVQNVTVPIGGSAIETDERLRRRIKLAPNQFSVAGSKGAYEFFTLSADPSIIDVEALNGGAINVNIYPLVATGLPSSDILSLVQAVLSDERIRPLTDNVQVISPTERTYTINAQITLYSWADADSLGEALIAAAEAYATAQREKLGLDVVRSQIIAALSLTGVYQVVLTEPVADIVITPNEWANASSLVVNVVGTNDG